MDPRETHDAPAHPRPRYMLIFWWLLGLTIAEILLATHLTIAETSKILLLVSLAVIKAALVALYFMHLKFERLSLGLTVSLTLVLALILVMMNLGQWLFHSPTVEMPPTHAAAPQK
jgi:caa(3)-type oxidase subunit IV